MAEAAAVSPLGPAAIGAPVGMHCSFQSQWEALTQLAQAGAVVHAGFSHVASEVSGSDADSDASNYDGSTVQTPVPSPSASQSLAPPPRTHAPPYEASWEQLMQLAASPTQMLMSPIEWAEALEPHLTVLRRALCRWAQHARNRLLRQRVLRAATVHWPHATLISALRQWSASVGERRLQRWRAHAARARAHMCAAHHRTARGLTALVAAAAAQVLGVSLHQLALGVCVQHGWQRWLRGLASVAMFALAQRQLSGLAARALSEHALRKWVSWTLLNSSSSALLRAAAAFLEQQRLLDYRRAWHRWPCRRWIAAVLLAEAMSLGATWARWSEARIREAAAADLLHAGRDVGVALNLQAALHSWRESHQRRARTAAGLMHADCTIGIVRNLAAAFGRLTCELGRQRFLRSVASAHRRGWSRACALGRWHDLAHTRSMWANAAQLASARQCLAALARWRRERVRAVEVKGSVRLARAVAMHTAMQRWWTHAHAHAQQRRSRGSGRSSIVSSLPSLTSSSTSLTSSLPSLLSASCTSSLRTSGSPSSLRISGSPSSLRISGSPSSIRTSGSTLSAPVQRARHMTTAQLRAALRESGVDAPEGAGRGTLEALVTSAAALNTDAAAAATPVTTAAPPATEMASAALARSMARSMRAPLLARHAIQSALLHWRRVGGALLARWPRSQLALRAWRICARWGRRQGWRAWRVRFLERQQSGALFARQAAAHALSRRAAALSCTLAHWWHRGHVVAREQRLARLSGLGRLSWQWCRWNRYAAAAKPVVCTAAVAVRRPVALTTALSTWRHLAAVERLGAQAARLPPRLRRCLVRWRWAARALKGRQTMQRARQVAAALGEATIEPAARRALRLALHALANAARARTRLLASSAIHYHIRAVAGAFHAVRADAAERERTETLRRNASMHACRRSLQSVCRGRWWFECQVARHARRAVRHLDALVARHAVAVWQRAAVGAAGRAQELGQHTALICMMRHRRDDAQLRRATVALRAAADARAVQELNHQITFLFLARRVWRCVVAASKAPVAVDEFGRDYTLRTLAHSRHASLRSGWQRMCRWAAQRCAIALRRGWLTWRASARRLRRVAGNGAHQDALAAALAGSHTQRQLRRVMVALRVASDVRALCTMVHGVASLLLARRVWRCVAAASEAAVAASDVTFRTLTHSRRASLRSGWQRMCQWAAQRRALKMLFVLADDAAAQFRADDSRRLELGQRLAWAAWRRLCDRANELWRIECERLELLQLLDEMRAAAAQAEAARAEAAELQETAGRSAQSAEAVASAVSAQADELADDCF